MATKRTSDLADHVILAGVAARNITPKPGLQLQGHWPAPPSHEVFLPLEVRALALRNGASTLVILSLDLIGLSGATDDKIKAQITQRLGVPGSHILIACSHTHCGPATAKDCGMTPDPTFMAMVESQSIACAQEAIATLVPAKLGLGCASGSFNINRRALPPSNAMEPNPSGVVDRRCRLLRVDRMDGSPLALLFHFSCHPTCKRSSEGRISSDYPGVARMAIEAELGCRALFMPGCFGNIRPAIVDSQGQFTAASDEQLLAIGHALARSICRAAKTIRTEPGHAQLASVVEQVHLQYGTPPTRDEMLKYFGDDPDYITQIINPLFKHTQALLAAGQFPKQITDKMQAMMIGPLKLVTIPGEPVQEIGFAIEAQFMNSGGDELWVMGYSNGSDLGYLVTEQQKKQGGYEPTAYIPCNQPAPFVNEQATLSQAAARLLQRVSL